MGYQTPGAPIMQSQMGVGGELSSALQQQQSPHLTYQTPNGQSIGAGNDGNPLQQQQQSLPPAHAGFPTPAGPSMIQQNQHQQSVSFQSQTPGGTSNIQSTPVNPQQQQHGLGFQTPAGSTSQHQQGDTHSHVRIPHHLRIGSDLSTQQPRKLSPVPKHHLQVQSQAQQLPPRPTSTPQLTQQFLPQQNILMSTSIETVNSIDEIIPLKPIQIAQQAAHSQESQSLYDGSTVLSHDSGVQSAPTPMLQHKEPPHMVVVPESRELEDATDTDNEVDAEEMRKLEEEFEKRLQRAKKSYGTRMDNLQRSKEEAEAQHQMTLEKHEKERIEYEKKVRLAEEEQNRRLSQIEKEFKEKKNQVRQQRAGQANGEKPPLHGGHKRSSSHFDPSMQRPTPAADLRRNISMQHPKMAEHRRNHSTQSSISCSASDVSEDQHQVGLSPKAPSSGGLFVEDMAHQPASNQTPLRQVDSSHNLRDRSDSTSSPA
jgi:hypothetical protein